MDRMAQSKSSMIDLGAGTTAVSLDPKKPTRYLLLAIEILGVAAVYFGAAKIGLSFAYINASVSPVWPPTGVAIAAVLLLGYRTWPGIFLGAFLVNLFTPLPVATATAIAVGNTAESLSALFILRALGFHKQFDRAKDVFKFVIAAFLGTTISSAIGNVSLCLTGLARWDDFSLLWRIWWLGDLAGALIVAPLLLTWIVKPQKWWRPRRTLEAVLLLLLLSATAIVIFGRSTPLSVRYYLLTCFIVPFLLWAAFRLGHRGVTLAIAALSAFAVWGTLRGLGPFIGGTTNESLMILQLFVASNAVSFLFLVAVVEERRVSEESRLRNETRVAVNLAITEILAESPALRQATPRMLETICTTLHWEVGAMWLLDPSATLLRCISFWSAHPWKVKEFEMTSRNSTFAIGVGLPGRVWERLKPSWIPELAKDNNFPRAPVAVREDLHACFAFPIIGGEKFVGVMEFFSGEIRQPDGALLAMFGGIGGQIGQFMERRRAEDALGQVAAIVESTDDAIIGMDLDGMVNSWNNAANELYGYSADEIIGKNVSVLIPPEHFQDEGQILTQIRSGERIVHYETVRMAKSGTRIDVSLTVSPIQDASGAVIGASKIARDITERRRVEAEREELLKREHDARAEAEVANRVKDEFLATLSHELRTPLNAIVGWAGMLRNNQLNPAETRRAIEIIDRNAKAQTQLIESVLDVSRIVSGKLQFDLRPVEVAKVIETAVDSMRPTADAKNIRFRLHVSGNIAPVSGDFNRLQQVVWNLLSNAVKFSPNGNEVEVQLKTIAGHVQIVVRDHGQGISADFLPHVFERFRQADASTTRRFGGLGLGLAIVRHLVEMHGGSVKVESDGKGQGASFTVTLPIMSGDAHSDEGPAVVLQENVTARPRLRGVKILLVEDEIDTRELLVEMLSGCDAEVIAAESASVALGLLVERQPDILVSDISMPDVDGYTFIRQVRNGARHSTVPAIALTAHARAEDRRLALAAGFQEHLAKPVSLSDLAQSIARLVGSVPQDLTLNDD